MKRSLIGLAALALGAALLAPVAALAGSPAGTFDSAIAVDTQDPDPCVGMFGLALCDRPGGIVAKGQKALLVTWDGDDVIEHSSSDGGDTWSAGGKIGGGTLPAIAQDGDLIAYAYRGTGLDDVIRAGWSFGVSDLDAPADGFDEPRQLTTEVVADVENGVFVWAAFGYDEATQARKGNAIRLYVKTDGIGDPITRTIAWGGLGCLPTGTDPSVAVTGNGVVVLAYWKDCDTLLVRRSKDLGATFSAPQVLSTRTHKLGMSIEAEGTTVVLAYTADGTTWTRRSADQGKTWGPPRQVGSGATSLRLSYIGGAWHLLAGGKTSVRYRTSANGSTWSAGETVDGLQDARTYALGVAYAGGEVLAAYSIRQPRPPSGCSSRPVDHVAVQAPGGHHHPSETGRVPRGPRPGHVRPPTRAVSTRHTMRGCASPWSAPSASRSPRPAGSRTSWMPSHGPWGVPGTRWMCTCPGTDARAHPVGPGAPRGRGARGRGPGAGHARRGGAPDPGHGLVRHRGTAIGCGSWNTTPRSRVTASTAVRTVISRTTACASPSWAGPPGGHPRGGTARGHPPRPRLAGRPRHPLPAHPVCLRPPDGARGHGADLPTTSPTTAGCPGTARGRSTCPTGWVMRTAWTCCGRPCASPTWSTR